MNDAVTVLSYVARGGGTDRKSRCCLLREISEVGYLAPRRLVSQCAAGAATDARPTR